MWSERDNRNPIYLHQALSASQVPLMSSNPAEEQLDIRLATKLGILEPQRLALSDRKRLSSRAANEPVVTDVWDLTQDTIIVSQHTLG